MVRESACVRVLNFVLQYPVLLCVAANAHLTQSLHIHKLSLTKNRRKLNNSSEIEQKQTQTPWLIFICSRLFALRLWKSPQSLCVVKELKMLIGTEQVKHLHKKHRLVFYYENDSEALQLWC